MQISGPRGTNDILPSDSERSPKWDRIFEVHRWVELETIFREIVRRSGYQEVRTPIFEELELFKRSSGESSEVVNKQMFAFLDQKGRQMALKPEGTAPVVRSMIEWSMLKPNSVHRLSYITPIFRYERPQRGRYRQGHQVGLELVGSASPEADVEVIRITSEFYDSVRIPGVRVRLNSIGRSETRARYREAILKFVEPKLGAWSEEFRNRAMSNPLRLLDSKDPAVVEAMEGAPSILDHLEDASREHLNAVTRGLSRCGIDYELDPGIVRGLDYYSDTVFEVLSTDLGSQSALCGGGRYDGLVKELGGPATPCVGVAMGIERTLIVQDSLCRAAAPVKLDVFVISSLEHAEQAERLSGELRKAGFSVVRELEYGSLKSQMKAADRLGARLAVILGEDELAAGKVGVKDLASGEQRTVELDRLAEAIQPK